MVLGRKPPFSSGLRPATSVSKSPAIRNFRRRGRSRKFGSTIFHPHPRPATTLPSDSRLSLTTRGLAADYLALCRNPLSDIRRWVLESGKAYQGRSPSNTWRSADAAQSPSPGLGSRTDRLRYNALHEMRGRLDPFRDRRQGCRLSSRPGAGISQYDQLRSFRAQGKRSTRFRSALRTAAASATNSVAPSSSLATELAAAKGYYASRIAAARQSLSRVELAAAIKAIKDEQTLAARAIIQRWEGYFQNRKEIPDKGPERPSDQRPLLRYPGLRKS